MLESKDSAEDLRRENASLKDRIIKLETQIDWLNKQLFSNTKSEKINPNQMEIFSENELNGLHPDIESETIEVESKKHTKRVTRKKNKNTPESLQHLPLKERIEHIPEEVKANPEDYVKISEGLTVKVDMTPARFERVELLYPKYKKRKDRKSAPIRVKAEPQLITGGLPTTNWVVQTIIAKYLYHIPLDRQVKVAKRMKIEIETKNLCSWLGTAADVLEPIYNKIKDLLVLENYIQVDETPIKYIEGAKIPNGKTCQGYFWLFNVPGGHIYYKWSEGRAHCNISDVIGDNWDGTLQCDGYSAYVTYDSKNESSSLGSCLVHVRRNFFALKGNESKYTPWILEKIGEIYKHRKEWKDHPPPERERLRKEFDLPILDELKATFIEIKTDSSILPSNPLTKAANYALGQWDGIVACAKDGRMEWDNNLVENAVRPTKLGQKNWLFIGHKDAGKRAAIFYTLVENCNRYGIDPSAYLNDVIDTIIQSPSPDLVDATQLLPLNWKNRKLKELEALQKLAA